MIDIALILGTLFALGSALLTVARSYRSPWRMLLLSMPLLIVLVPGFGNAPAVRVEEILLFILAPLIIIRKPIYKLAKIELLFLLYGIAILLSIFVGYLREGTIFARDFLEFARLAKYWLMVRLATSLAWSQENVSDALKVLLWTGLIAACVAFSQSRDSFAINTYYTPLFIKDFRLDTVQFQVPGTIQNYNLFGAFLAIVACVALGIILFANTSCREKTVTIGILFALFLALAMTTSKGSVIALLISAILLWLLRLALVRSRRVAWTVTLVAVLAVGILVGWTAFALPDSQAVRLSSPRSRDHPLQALASRFKAEPLERSFELRASDWEIAVDLATKSIVFGSGPSKDEEILAFHSEYLTHLRRYGLFGLSVYLLLLGTTALTVFLCLKRNVSGDRKKDDYTGALLASTLGAVFVFVITGTVYQVFQQLQLAAIFWWLIGIACGYCSGPASRLALPKTGNSAGG